MPMAHKTTPSIFNDVIGPVMRGPSSSHCAAAVRIGRLTRDLMDGDIREVLVQFDPNGSLATTHESQGSDMGLFGGILGWNAADERLPHSVLATKEAGIHFDIQIIPIEADHPNTYKLAVKNDKEQHTLTAISTGGGVIEIIEIDSVPVSLKGDCYTTLFCHMASGDQLFDYLKHIDLFDTVRSCEGKRTRFIVVNSQNRVKGEVLETIKRRFKPAFIKQLAPVLPILSRPDIEVPFITCEQMMAYNKSKDLKLWELALAYESARGGIESHEVLQKMANIINIIKGAIKKGLAGTHYDDRILGYQCGRFTERLRSGDLIDGGVLNPIILYTTALMESKSAMGVIVAAPTAGACGGLPGACVGAAEKLGLSEQDMAKALLAGAMIGIFISAHATFAAEVGGCQAECGAGSGMAAAALVNLVGGTASQAVRAASMALQNILGMICDPVANRVEVPCLGKNVMAAANALACANMALAGYDSVVPLDEVIQTMAKVGRMLPAALRCTGLGGLSMTKTSKDIEKRLAEATRQ